MTDRLYTPHPAHNHIRDAIIIAAAFACIGQPVLSHEWYPLACCSEKDCFEVPASEVRATPEGWRIDATGEVIPYDKTRTTPPEGGGHFHRCSFNGDPSGATIGMGSYPRACFWAPGMEG